MITKILVKSLVLLSLYVLLPLISFAQFQLGSYLKSHSETIEAKEYKRIVNLLQEINSQNTLIRAEDSVAYNINQVRFESLKVRYRNEAIKFWFKFPKSPLRFSLMSPMMRFHGIPFNSFWLDINANIAAISNLRMSLSYSVPIDMESLKEWEKVYAIVRKEYIEFLNSSYRDSAEVLEKIEDIYLAEIKNILTLSLNQEYRNYKKLDLNVLKGLFLHTDILTHKGLTASNAEAIMAYLFLGNYSQYGLTANDVLNFLESFNEMKIPAIKNWVYCARNLINLTKKPLRFKGTTISGGEINVKHLKGKVVLIDFWSTSCSSCIERMPAIKDVYDRYKNRGFLVISACINSELDKPKVLAIYNRIGADWPLMILGGNARSGYMALNSVGREIWDKYGFKSVPQLFLLDQRGKLVLFNDILREGDFEAIVKEHLEQN